MKSKKNAFTLIELLAIIVILAIIAVITVPIILNIIENSKKGAATDSAYGYKDAVNKAYVQELAKPNNGSLKLDGIYTVQNTGILVPDSNNTAGFGVTGYNSLPVSMSGDKPSSGKLRYSNNVLNAGCLVIGDYKITFNASGSVDQTEKGNCANYEFPSADEQDDSYSMARLCPECVYAKNNSSNQQSIGSELTIAATEGYDSYGSSFLGYVVEDDIVKRAFVCGIEGTNVFCLEGTNEAEDTLNYENNVDILRHFYDYDNDCDILTSTDGNGENEYVYTVTCPEPLNAGVDCWDATDGYVAVGDCLIYNNGSAYCS